MDWKEVTPANSALVGGMTLMAMTADHGNPAANLAAGAVVGAAVGVGARIKKSLGKRNQHFDEGHMNARND